VASIIWSGTIDAQLFRVVDAGAGNSPRLTVELQATPDAMGVPRWQAYDPLPIAVFEGILLSAGVVV